MIKNFSSFPLWKRFFLAGMFCFLMKAGFTQSGFSFMDRYGFPAAEFYGIELIDDTVYAGGFTVTDSALYYYRSLLMKFDTNGTPLDKHKIPDNDHHHTIDYETRYQGFCELPNGDFAACGNTFTFPIASMVGYVCSFDKAGNTLFSTLIPPDTTNFITMKNMAPWDTNYILVGGQEQYLLTPNTSVVLAKIDLSGNLIWKKKYGLSNYCEDIGSICALPNGNFLIGAERNNVIRHYAINEVSNTWIFEIDTAGNIVNEWLDNDNKTYKAVSLQPTSDGNFVYGIAYKDYQVMEDVYKTGKIRKSDPSFNPVWTCDVGVSSFLPHINKLSVQPDGGILGCGTDFVGDPGNSYFYGYVYKTDHSGQKIWERRYRHINHGIIAWVELSSLVTDDQNSIYACGRIVNLEADSFPNQSWLIKLDSMGCLIPGCNETGVENNPLSGPDILIYPNPSADYIFIECAGLKPDKLYDFQIIDMQGKEIFRSKLASDVSNSLSLHDYKPGTYFIKITDENGNHAVRSFIKR